METVRLAFYKAQKGDFWGNAIATYTGLFNKGLPPYCHCEVGLYINNNWKWYSSASRNWDGTNGTRWITEERLFKNKYRWDIVEVAIDRDIFDMYNLCVNEINKPYDWLGIMGFVTITGQVNSRNKWYCSEVCNYIITGKWMKRISPKALFVRVKSMGGNYVAF